MAKLFEVGTKAQFDALKVKDNNVMYWLTDTQELYKGDIRYAVGKLANEDNDGLLSSDDKKLLNVLRNMMEVAESNGANIAVASVGIGEGAVIGSYTNPMTMDMATTPAIMDMAATPAIMDMANIDNQIEAYSEWIVDYRYPWYDCYYDDDYSYVDENKNIRVSKGQINIS